MAMTFLKVLSIRWAFRQVLYFKQDRTLEILGVNSELSFHMQHTVWDPPLAEDLNMSPRSSCCLILKRLIDNPSVLVGGVDNLLLLVINFSKSSAFLSVVKTSKNISTLEVKQAKWPNLKTKSF